MSEYDEPQAPTRPGFGRWMGSMWLYTVLRFGLFFALWGILLLCGLRGFFAPLVALVLSVPLSLVLLAKPRAAFTQTIEARMLARQEQRAEFDARLDSDDAHDSDTQADSLETDKRND